MSGWPSVTTALDALLDAREHCFRGRGHAVIQADPDIEATDGELAGWSELACVAKLLAPHLALCGYMRLLRSG